MLDEILVGYLVGAPLVVSLMAAVSIVGVLLRRSQARP